MHVKDETRAMLEHQKAAASALCNAAASRTWEIQTSEPLLIQRPCNCSQWLLALWQK